MNCLLCGLKINDIGSHYRKIHNLNDSNIKFILADINLDKILKHPIYIPLPNVNFNSQEYISFRNDYILYTEFIFNESKISILKSYFRLIIRKIEKVEIGIAKAGGGTYVRLKYELKCLLEIKNKLEEKIANNSKGSSVKNNSDAYINGSFWDKVEFDDGLVYINYEKARKLKLVVPPSSRFLNQLKETYFKKKYSTYEIKFSLVGKKRIIDYSGFPSIEEILRLDYREIDDILVKINNEESFANSNCNSTKISKELISKNKYIEIAASLLTLSDNIYPIKENNNGKIEESIFFVYYRKVGVYVLIENENEKRSAYLLFFYNFKDEYLELLKGYFESSNIKNKRDKIHKKIVDFSKTLNTSVFKYILYHYNTEQYKIRLNTTIGKFSIK